MHSNQCAVIIYSNEVITIVYELGSTCNDVTNAKFTNTQAGHTYALFHQADT